MRLRELAMLGKVAGFMAGKIEGFRNKLLYNLRFKGEVEDWIVKDGKSGVITGSIDELYEWLGVERKLEDSFLEAEEYEYARAVDSKVEIKMGGAGPAILLYEACRVIRPELVLESGVAFGWSSCAILSAMSRNKRGRLISIDRPYWFDESKKVLIGKAVPDSLKKRWSLYIGSNRKWLKRKRIAEGMLFDIVFYDSDKSFVGKAEWIEFMMGYLKTGGLLIVDDIGDDSFFDWYTAKKGIEAWRLMYDSKSCGIIRKQ